MTYWQKLNREEVTVTTAGGGCYVSTEEDLKHQDVGGFFLFACFPLSALIVWRAALVIRTNCLFVVICAVSLRDANK